MLKIITYFMLIIFSFEASSELVTRTGDFSYKKIVKAKQLKCLTDNVYFESRGEPVRGQMAVALVTLNRKYNKHYPNTICEVVYQRKRPTRCQFSWVCAEDSYKVVRDKDSYIKSLAIAEMVLVNYNYDIDLTYGATHYHEIKINPKWAASDKVTAVIGRHKFYKL